MYMKRIILCTISLLLGYISLSAQDSRISGPEGNIAYKVSLPKGFDTETGKCPMIILMHGIFSSKDYNPMPALAKELAKAGIASIRFDFDGHGKSEGRMEDMTIGKELADAGAVWNYVRSLPYVSEIGVLGHSQGGVIASMLAGRLAYEHGSRGVVPEGLVLLAPGAVIKEACQGGKFFNATFDPADPPEFIRCWGFMKLGREYLLTTQQLDIYGTASAYEGPVLLLHGDSDRIVPMWCSEKFLKTYGDHSELVVVKGGNHTISRKRKEFVTSTVDFFKTLFQGSYNNS